METSFINYLEECRQQILKLNSENDIKDAENYCLVKVKCLGKFTNCSNDQ